MFTKVLTCKSPAQPAGQRRDIEIYQRERQLKSSGSIHNNYIHFKKEFNPYFCAGSKVSKKTKLNHQNDFTKANGLKELTRICLRSPVKQKKQKTLRKLEKKTNRKAKTGCGWDQRCFPGPSKHTEATRLCSAGLQKPSGGWRVWVPRARAGCCFLHVFWVESRLGVALKNPESQGFLKKMIPSKVNLLVRPKTIKIIKITPQNGRLVKWKNLKVPGLTSKAIDGFSVTFRRLDEIYSRV